MYEKYTLFKLPHWPPRGVESLDEGIQGDTAEAHFIFSRTSRRNLFFTFTLKKKNQVSGAVLIASIFEILVGFTGIVGFLLRFIGPLTVTPTVGILGLAFFPVASEYASRHWGIAAL